MADAPFKKGDVVGLKSGGPLMTVEAVNAYSNGNGFQVETIWFAEDEVKRLTAHAEVLERIEAEDEE